MAGRHLHNGWGRGREGWWCYEYISEVDKKWQEGKMIETEHT